MQKAISWFMIFGVVVILACCKKKLGVNEYMQYVANSGNGLKKTMVVGGLEFSILYRPYDYIILLESKGDVHQLNSEKRRSDLQGTAWFSLDMKCTDNTTVPLKYGISSLAEYNTRLNYYLNKVKDDFWLIRGKDTLHPVSYLFENNYGLTPQQTMIVGFFLPKENADAHTEMQLAFDDRVFKNGIIKATFTKQALDRLPGLTYSN